MHHYYLFIIRLLVCSFLLMFTTVTSADSIESLLMPGPVIKAHEKFEHDCDQCHDTSDKDRQGKLCVACHDHENILDDLQNKTGFHGLLAKKESENCKHCHTEHEGRSATVVLLNASTFNHQNTDFPLQGVHGKTSCESCHKAEKKYAEATGICYDCHKKSDVHDGKQGEKCGDCHQPTGWKKTEFDHEKTDFPLKGAHKEASCAVCHLSQEYKDTPKTCISCHQIHDAHAGEFGNKCDNCHNSKKWDQALFDHNKKTDFPLSGKHEKASCSSCHHPDVLKARNVKPVKKKTSELKTKLPTKCYDCHKSDDAHKGRYGKKCKNCHSDTSWQKQKFDHDKDTKFTLQGKHKKTNCNLCHRGDLYKDELTTNCIDCHKQDDVHKGKQGRDCSSCHNEKGWHSNVTFDHDLFHFPLIGMHAATQCEECHISDEYSDTKQDCNYCHANDDVHKTRLGTDCESCHNPNSWETWLFDHDKATNFTIDGAHEELGCYDCHQTTSKGKLKTAKDCISCHRSEDIHHRQFGPRCGDCHSTKSFKDINIK